VPIPPIVADLVRDLFAHPPTLAILGATTLRHRAAYSVPAYLQHHGATILPVNPRYAGQAILDRTCASSVVEAIEALPAHAPIDAVVMFRRSEAVADHLSDLLDAGPTVVWMQLGIRSDSVANVLEQHGIQVVQDRCLKVDHARVLGF